MRIILVSKGFFQKRRVLLENKTVHAHAHAQNQLISDLPSTSRVRADEGQY